MQKQGVPLYIETYVMWQLQEIHKLITHNRVYIENYVTFS